MRAERAMEDCLNWRKPALGLIEGALRNVAKEYEQQNPNDELVKTRKRYALLSIVFAILLVVEVVFLQR